MSAAFFSNKAKNDPPPPSSTALSTTKAMISNILNAWGHTNICLCHLIWNHKYSTLRYLFYNPEFHLGHHAYFCPNYCLFMPIWDHLLGTYQPYLKPDVKLALPNKQNFVFLDTMLPRVLCVADSSHLKPSSSSCICFCL